MYKKRITGEEFAVETHGRASLRAMPVGKMRGGMFLVVGLALLFGACEKDLGGGFGDGKKVEIFFSTDITNYHAGGDVVRSGGMEEAESTTVYLNDSIYLQSTLVPDEDEDLRATVGFIDGQKLCFEAYNTASPGTAVDSKMYTYSLSEGKFIPDTDPLGVVPDGATTYRFVAYSYFGETGAPATTVDLSKDLVWGKSADGTVVDTELSRTVSINMLHKFARVKVKVQSGIPSATITVLQDVEIVGGTQATLVPFDGSFSAGSALTQGVDFDESELPTDEIESGQRMVFPVAAAKVKFGTVEVSVTSTTFSDQTVTFNSGLVGGTSYTLVVDVKRCIWARSNIYWEWKDDEDHSQGGKLTFVTDANDLSKQGYQGVFFKWGSLVGVSPAQKSGSNDSQKNAFDGTVPIYVPIVNSTLANSTWKATNGNAMKDDADFSTVSSNWTTWNYNAYGDTDIPYLDRRHNTSGHLPDGADNRYAIEAEQNDLATYQGFRGDICQYLSKTGAVTGNYRLPTESEASGSWTHGTNTSIYNSLGNAEGTVDLLDVTYNLNWSKNSVIEGAVFPASGRRSQSGGGLGYVGGNGTMFWTGGTNISTTDGANNICLARAYPGGNPFRTYGLPVRCILNLD
jgi:hypothetical protein